MSTDKNPKNTSVTIDEVDDDELDELLNETLSNFNAPPKPTPNAAPSAQTSAASSEKKTPADQGSEEDDDLLNDAFAKQLAKGMEELMQQIGDAPGGFDALLKSFEELEAPSSASGANSMGAVPSGEGGKTFKDKIEQTMNKLKDSSEQIGSNISEQETDSLMAEMMKQMESMADTGEFNDMLEGMMKQLMSKDVLYEPLKELSEKYPQYLEENKASIPQEDYARYEKQYQVVQQIVSKYESASFKEDDEAQAEEIAELMQKMQDFGQPPSKILEDLTPEGMELDENGIPKNPDGEPCSIM
ncbi:uncharacterized protein VTP21DRAFT_1409 [Calcarisporiella thermophila]|uniref:uncharacterized protein n=1 Tax=Calcarisporiella thermophila TaxID=911321 RepID=UPI003743C89C